MDNKVILILVDGMRPDGMMQCGNSFIHEILTESTYTLEGRTVMPSVTLPCHMSLFHSVDPSRHGIVCNTYVPQVRPVNGIFEQLDMAGKKNALFYTWEELRDLSRMDHLHCAVMLNQHHETNTDQSIADMAIRYINAENPDFLFLYLGETDEVGGHDCGWMSPTYLKCVANALDCVERVRKNIPEDYNIILLADHGGHDRSHGTEMPEDMTIPVVFNGPAFPKNRKLDGISIKDIAPTITDLLGAKRAKEWEGRSVFEQIG